MPDRRMTARLVFGLVIIALGVIFTLDNLGYLDAHVIVRWWPALLLAYGLMRLAGVLTRRHVASGLILSAVGGWLLLDRFGILHQRLWDFWPLVLVILGVSMVSGGLSRRESAGLAPGDVQDSTVNAFAMWSGTTQRVVSQNYRGGEISAIMGGHDIDLRAARIEGGPAVIDLFIWLGGVTLRIPEDWKVSCQPSLIMGGIDVRARAPVGEPRGHLVLKGVIVMGGVEVKN